MATFAWLLGAAKKENGGAFVSTAIMQDYSLGMESIPYWDTLYELDTTTGAFVDVSKQYPQYYREKVIPKYTMMLAGTMKESVNDENAGYLVEIKRAYTDVLLRAYSIVDGKPRKKLPALPTF